MASTNMIGLAMGLDVSSLKQGLDEAKKRISEADAEFSAKTSGMDNWMSSIEGVTAKLDFLKTKLSEQKRMLAGYEASLQEQIDKQNKLQKEYDESVEATGKNSKASKDLKAKLDAQENSIRNLNITINKQKAAIGKTEVETRKYEGTLDKLENSTEEVTTEVKQNTTALKKNEQQMDANVDSAKKLDGGFTILKGAVANLISSGISALVGVFSQAVTEGKQLRGELGMLEATANTMGASMENAESKMRDVYAITQDTTAATEGLNNLMSAGFDGEGLNDVADMLLGASIKFKDTLKFEGLSDGLQETLATGKAIGPFSELLERSGVNLETFDAGLAQCTTEAEKQNYVLQELSKLGLTDVLNEYNELNGALSEENKMAYDNQRAMARLGEALSPLTIFLQNLKNHGINAVASALEHMRPYLDVFIGAINKLLSGDMSGINDLATLFMSLRDKVLEILPTIIESAVGVVSQLITSLASQLPTYIQMLVNELIILVPVLLQGAITLFTALVDAIPVVIESLLTLLPTLIDTLTNFFITNVPVILESAITLLNTIVEAIPVILQSLVQKLPTIMTSITNYMTQAMPLMIESAIALFMQIVNSIPLIITPLLQSLPTILSSIITFLLDSIPMMLENAVKLFNGIVDAIPVMIETLIATIPLIVTAIWDTLVAVDWLDLGKNIIQGILDGMTSMGNAIWKAIKAVGNSMLDGIKKFFGIESPSKLMRDEVGTMLGLGIGKGVVGSTKSVLKDIKKFDNAILDGLHLDKQVSLNGSASGGLLGGTTNSSVVTFTQNITTTSQPTAKELARYTDNLLNLNKVRGYVY